MAILITGANRGLGLELVRQHLAEGAEVVACCREPVRAVMLHRLAADYPGRLHTARLDVGDPASIAELGRAVGEVAIDILYNVAGVYGPREQEIGWDDPDQWLEIFSVNTIGPLRVVRALLPRLGPGSKIVTLSSKIGASGCQLGGRYAYGASKAAVNRITQSLARDLRGKEIIAVVLCPGWVKTDMGGSAAELDAEVSVAGIRRVVGSLTIGDSGSFLHWDGLHIAW